MTAGMIALLAAKEGKGFHRTPDTMDYSCCPPVNGKCMSYFNNNQNSTQSETSTAPILAEIDQIWLCSKLGKGRLCREVNCNQFGSRWFGSVPV